MNSYRSSRLPAYNEISTAVLRFFTTNGSVNPNPLAKVKPDNFERSKWAVKSFGLGLAIAGGVDEWHASEWMYGGVHQYSDKLLYCFLHEARELHHHSASDYEFDSYDLLQYVFGNALEEENDEED